MNTDALIRALVADQATIRPSSDRTIMTGLAFGGVSAAILFLLLLGLRPAWLEAVASFRVILKIAAPLLLAAGGVVILRCLARPGAQPGQLWWLLTPPAGLLAAGILAELALTPSSAWGARLVGSNALMCLAFVLIFAAAPFVALLSALHRAAPTRPGVAGAMAGLVSGGLAAFLYANHCPDDSPLFVATWYTLSIGLVTLTGAALGPRLLRW